MSGYFSIYDLFKPQQQNDNYDFEEMKAALNQLFNTNQQPNIEQSQQQNISQSQPRAMNKVERELAKNLINAKTAYGAATNDAGRAAAHQAAENQRAIASNLGINLDPQYGSGVTLNQAMNNLQTNDYIPLQELLDNDLTSEQYYDKTFRELLNAGLSAGQARRRAASMAGEYKQQRMQKLSNYITTYGLSDDNRFNSNGIRALVALAMDTEDPISNVGNVLSQSYAKPANDYENNIQLARDAIQHGYNLETLAKNNDYTNSRLELQNRLSKDYNTYSTDNAIRQHDANAKTDTEAEKDKYQFRKLVDSTYEIAKENRMRIQRSIDAKNEKAERIAESDRQWYTQIARGKEIVRMAGITDPNLAMKIIYGIDTVGKADGSNVKEIQGLYKDIIEHIKALNQNSFGKDNADLIKGLNEEAEILRKTAEARFGVDISKLQNQNQNQNVIPEYNGYNQAEIEAAIRANAPYGATEEDIKMAIEEWRRRNIK